jgi:glycosyltransferase involved in cell wall biosynthesis
LENNHSAILVPPGSSKLLENALQKLLGDDKLKTILSQNANQAVQKFKLHDMVIATVEVYKKPL